MSKLTVEDTSLVSVADAIRTKGGTTDTLIFPDGFVDAIGNIQSGSGETVYNITETSYPIFCSPSGWSATSKTCVKMSAEKNISLFGNVSVKASSGSLITGAYYGSVYYMSVSISWTSIITSIFADNMLADGSYTIYWTIGLGVFNFLNTNMTISNGKINVTSLSAQAYSNTKSPSISLHIVGIMKTA